MAPPNQFTSEDVARVCTEATRAYSEALGDTSDPRWENIEPWRHAFANEGVDLVLRGGSDSELHDLWRKHKQAAGWTAGTRDTGAKKSENLVPYDHLGPVAVTKNAIFSSTAVAVQCGHERWDVKTLKDPDASAVQLDQVQPGKVEALVKLPRPAKLPFKLAAGAKVPAPAPRAVPQECAVYRVPGNIMFAKLESGATGDSDIHLVLASQNDPKTTMIVEATCPGCATGSRVISQITAVRAAVEAKFPDLATKAYDAITGGDQPVPVTVTGVAYFDYAHGQTGLAPNGIELHPILDFAL
jgi:hypothetical protein